MDQEQDSVLCQVVTTLRISYWCEKHNTFRDSLYKQFASSKLVWPGDVFTLDVYKAIARDYQTDKKSLFLCFLEGFNLSEFHTGAKNTLHQAQDSEYI